MRTSRIDMHEAMEKDKMDARKCSLCWSYAGGQMTHNHDCMACEGTGYVPMEDPPPPARPHACGHPMPASEPHAVCGNCKLHACDECADDWKVCFSCSGGICVKCEVSAQKRHAYRKGDEYICDPCGDKFRAARSGLILALRGVVADLERGIWVDAVMYDIEAAVAHAKRKADL